MGPAPIDAAAAATLLRTLANPARLRILLALLAGERSVAALESGLDLRQPMLSQHLGALREAGLVAARRESRAVFYGLAGEGARRLAIALVEGFGGSVAPPASPAAPPGRRPVEAAVFATVGEVR
jgi:DNA-binding transcriptional ArsR family regulator